MQSTAAIGSDVEWVASAKLHIPLAPRLEQPSHNPYLTQVGIDTCFAVQNPAGAVSRPQWPLNSACATKLAILRYFTYYGDLKISKHRARVLRGQ
jgi:hypothetical protein